MDTLWAVDLSVLSLRTSAECFQSIVSGLLVMNGHPKGGAKLTLTEVITLEVSSHPRRKWLIPQFWVDQINLLNKPYLGLILFLLQLLVLKDQFFNLALINFLLGLVRSLSHCPVSLVKATFFDLLHIVWAYFGRALAIDLFLDILELLKIH